MRERAGLRRHVLPGADLVDAPLRRVAGRVDLLARELELAPLRDLELQREALIVSRFDRAVVEPLDLSVPAEFVGDRIDRRLVGAAISRLAQHGGCRDRRWQAGIVAGADDDAGAVERLEQAARLIDIDGVEAEGGQVSTTGGDVVDAEGERVRSDDVHGAYPPEIQGRAAVRPPSVS